MTFDEFVKTYKGKRIDYDKAYGVQCVDLAKLYIDKVLGIKPQSIGNAEAYWNRYETLNYLKSNFEKIENYPAFIPKKGDIAVWGLKHNKWGHIAICDGEGTTSYFYSYDENWGGRGQGMTRIKHSYKSGFEGVLRPRNQTILVTENEFTFGQDIEIHVPIVPTGAKEGELVQVESGTVQNEKGSKQYWIHNSVIKDGQIIARAKVCFIEGNRIMVQIFNNQFWINTENVAKKL